jgi:hypothetical protein
MKNVKYDCSLGFKPSLWKTNILQSKLLSNAKCKANKLSINKTQIIKNKFKLIKEYNLWKVSIDFKVSGLFLRHILLVLRDSWFV